MNTKNAQGFTLVELMVTIAILAILVTAGLPAFQDYLKNNRIITTTNELISAANLARTAAVQYSTRATLCVSKNQAGCAGTNWADGWLVWVDKNRDGSMNSGEEIQYFTTAPSAVSIAGPASTIAYDDRGNVTSGTGSFSICDDRTGETGRQITLAPTGRTSINRSYTCP